MDHKKNKNKVISKFEIKWKCGNKINQDKSVFFFLRKIIFKARFGVSCK
jgi:hypothetical protein